KDQADERAGKDQRVLDAIAASVLANPVEEEAPARVLFPDADRYVAEERRGRPAREQTGAEKRAAGQMTDTGQHRHHGARAQSDSGQILGSRGDAAGADVRPAPQPE